MPNSQAQIDCVIAYLQKHFAEAKPSPKEHGAWFHVTTQEGACCSLQLGQPFIEKFTEPVALGAQLVRHNIAQRMRECGDGSVVSLLKPSEEPSCDPPA